MAELGEGDSSYGKGIRGFGGGSKPSLFGSGGPKGAICAGPVDPDTQQKPLFVVNLAEQLKGKIIERPPRPRGPSDGEYSGSGGNSTPVGPPRYAQHNPLGTDTPQMPYDPNMAMANYGKIKYKSWERISTRVKRIHFRYAIVYGLLWNVRGIHESSNDVWTG